MQTQAIRLNLHMAHLPLRRLLTLIFRIVKLYCEWIDRQIYICKRDMSERCLRRVCVMFAQSWVHPNTIHWSIYNTWIILHEVLYCLSGSITRVTMPIYIKKNGLQRLHTPTTIWAGKICLRRLIMENFWAIALLLRHHRRSTWKKYKYWYPA